MCPTTSGHERRAGTARTNRCSMTWEEDRKYVLEALKDNRDDHKEICTKLDKIVEAHGKLTVKVAGIAGTVGLLSAALAHLILY